MRRDKHPVADRCLVDTHPEDKRPEDTHPAADMHTAEADTALAPAAPLMAAQPAEPLRALVPEQLDRVLLMAADSLRVLLAWMPLAAAPLPVQSARVMQSAALRELLVVSQHAPQRLQTLCSARCQRNMSRY